MLLCIPSRSIFSKKSASKLSSDSYACAGLKVRRVGNIPVYLIFLLFITIISSCSQPDKDAGMDVYNNLELNGRISTFPLNIILSDKLSGTDFPADLKELCGFSKETCKTLPIAGILRSGSDIYYTYNCFADLKIPEPANKNEAGITEAVEKQVDAYFANTKPAAYDSLLTPNLPDWNIQNFARMYVGNTADSVFFYSNEPDFPSTIMVGNRTFPVYKEVARLRKEIDNIICRGYEKIAVFYNPVSGSTTPAPTETTTVSVTAAPETASAKTTSASETAPAKTLPTPTLPTPEARKPVNSVREQANDEGLSISTPPPPRTDNPSARRGEPVCEQDEHKNYTGRRVQYIYNKQGDIVRTIVISKCEADCRCF